VNAAEGGHLDVLCCLDEYGALYDAETAARRASGALSAALCFCTKILPPMLTFTHSHSDTSMM